MKCKIEVRNKKGFADKHGAAVRHATAEIGLSYTPKNVSYAQLYALEGDISEHEVRKCVSELLIDPVTQEYKITYEQPIVQKSAKVNGLEIWLKSGVTDTVAQSVAKAIKDLGIEKNITVKTGHKYVFSLEVKEPTIKLICERLLANTIVHRYEFI